MFCPGILIRHLQNQVSGLRPRIITATNTRRERVFLLSQHSRTSMVGRAGQPKGWPVGDPVVSTLHVSPP